MQLSTFIPADGAMGTLMASSAPEQLCLTHPGQVEEVHRRYIAAGARMITTNSFCAADPLICLAAARIARRAAGCGADIIVAGSIGPCNDETEARLRAAALAEGGVDLILLETMTSVAATLPVLDGAMLTGLPVIVSAAQGRGGLMLSGESIAQLCRAVAFAGPLAIGMNCGGDYASLTAIAAEVEREGMKCYLAPSAGLPDARGNYPHTPNDFAGALAPLVREGKVAVAGGCCGTTPAHTLTLINCCG